MIRYIVVDLSLLSLLPKRKNVSLSLHVPLSLSLSLFSRSLPPPNQTKPNPTALSLPLVAPRPDVVRQRHQRRRGPRVERAQLRLRVRDQVGGDLPRFLQPEQRRVGGLLRGQVLSRRLAQDLGRLRDVEDVVDDLEGEADRAGVGAQGRDLGGRGAAEERARDDRGLKQGGLGKGEKENGFFSGFFLGVFFCYFGGQRGEGERAEATRREREGAS